MTLGAKGDYNTIRRLAKKSRIFRPLYRMFEVWHAAYLPLDNTIEGPLRLPHGPLGCVFARSCKIGTNCTILHHVTIGGYYNAGNQEIGWGGAPQIGNNVFIGAGAKLIGKIKIGNNVKIGAGCVVVTDIPDNATVVMHKPRIIIKE